MNNNDILGTQNWKENQADPFLAQKIAIFGKYLYVDNVDEIFIRIRICTWTTYSPYVRIRAVWKMAYVEKSRFSGNFVIYSQI